jgi:hypothetical protein
MITNKSKGHIEIRRVQEILVLFIPSPLYYIKDQDTSTEQ